MSWVRAARRPRRVAAAVVAALFGLAQARAVASSAATPPPGAMRAAAADAADARLAYVAAMGGRKAETLAAAQRLATRVPVGRLLAEGDSGWQLTPQYAVLVRFGLWDELIAMRPPDPRAHGLTAGFLYGRGVALASRGQDAEAGRALAELRRLGESVPADERAGHNSLRDVIGVAVAIVGARIAASDFQNGAAIEQLERAVRGEDALGPDDPADWFFPARQLLGAQLLEAGRAAEAERVYRADLKIHPDNGWSLYGLAAALGAQGRRSAARRAQSEFESAWKSADVRLVASAFWFAGPDTTSCECQREDSADRQPGGELLGTQHEARVH